MNKNAWRKKTDAKILSLSRLRKMIREQNGLAIGLVGFSGSFEKSASEDAESHTMRVFEAMLESKAAVLAPRPVFLVSGATDLGVPRIGYLAGKRAGCVSVGVTSEAAIEYPIAELEYLTLVGKKFGDESDAFISVLNELWVAGGGRQSMDECNLALKAEIPLTVIQGIGGIADSLSSDNINATFIDIEQYFLSIAR